uniref:Uncharacterized protein n=1 Tax=Varanus komodoensis TaxID=61221 RepID=A0A8D2J696_VARKO
MEKLKSHAASPSKGNDITALAGKLKRVALNMPVWFSTQARRPHSKSTARFGSLSHHAFFSRHNPHPHRVTHIQGLNGAPVCTVKDEWSVQTSPPPHPMRKSQFQTAALGMLAIQIPIGDPQPIPVPTLTIGLCTMYMFSSIISGVKKGLSTFLSQWTHLEFEKFLETQYSEETGRLIPLSSRATTRHSSHCLRKNNARNKGKDAILSFQGQELIVSSHFLSLSAAVPQLLLESLFSDPDRKWRTGCLNTPLHAVKSLPAPAKLPCQVSVFKPGPP